MREETRAYGAAGARSARTTSARRSARRALIMGHAARLFHRQGYAATSMQQIADAVGLSKPSLYYYVNSKDDLLFVMLEEVNDAGEEIVSEVMTMPVSPLQQLAAYVRAWVGFNVDHLAEVAVYTRELNQLDRRRRRAIEQGRERRFEFVTALVRAAQAAGEVGPEPDADAVGHVTLGLVGYMHTWYQPRQGPGGAELGDLMASMVIGGLSRRGG
ncbi:MAG TPA: TetR/AcrR family transcriptional regulator [Solirubrobacteraceae bacterium]|nr:TetR/AcrR family transcriptional regulator [Solirubrobacteraceae bacterium]